MSQINLPLVQYHLPSPLESLDLMECIHCGRNFNQQALKRRGMAMASYHGETFFDKYDNYTLIYRIYTNIN